MTNLSEKAISDVVKAGIQTVDELAAALATAMRLELATLPPYLCAQWSIDADPNEGDLQVEPMIQQIAVQEMYHFALAGNISAAIGHPPRFAFPDFTPTYPTHKLPGEIYQTLPVDLKALSPAQLTVFMQIENPQFPAVEIKPGLTPELELDTPPATIGDFYDTILDALGRLTLRFDGTLPAVQIGEAFAIANADDAIKAIKLIKDEGEGFPDSPGQTSPSGNRLAHFYIFEMISKGVPYVFKNGTWQTDPSKRIVFPTTHDFRAADDPEATVEFAKTWTSLLKSLENAWKPGGFPDVLMMRDLERLGKGLISNGIRPEFSWSE